MIINGNELYKLLDKIFEVNEFVRKKDTYYFNTAECICFFSIGKSPFGGHYDHVMGCFLREISKEKTDFPKFNKSHLKYSLRELDDQDLIKQVFDLENQKFLNTQRETIIKKLIEEKAIPFLKDVSTKAGIVKAIKKYDDLIHWTKSDLLDHLNIT